MQSNCSATRGGKQIKLWKGPTVMIPKPSKTIQEAQHLDLCREFHRSSFLRFNFFKVGDTIVIAEAYETREACASIMLEKSAFFAPPCQGLSHTVASGPFIVFVGCLGNSTTAGTSSKQF